MKNESTQSLIISLLNLQLSDTKQSHRKQTKILNELQNRGIIQDVEHVAKKCEIFTDI